LAFFRIGCGAESWPLRHASPLLLSFMSWLPEKSNQAATRIKSGRCCAAFIPKEALMRIPALAISTIAAVLTATPALAQTYDPKYPVCLQIYQGFTDYYFECAYTSLAQCNMSASGRAAACVINPYYAGGKTSPGRRARQQRRVD
jgi:hypothetical protein